MRLVVEFVGQSDLTPRFHVVADVATEVADFDGFGGVADFVDFDDFEVAAADF